MSAYLAYYTLHIYFALPARRLDLCLFSLKPACLGNHTDYHARSIRSRPLYPLTLMYVCVLSSDHRCMCTAQAGDDDEEVAQWIRSSHWLWETQTRFLAGNFTRFASQVLEPDSPFHPTREAVPDWVSSQSGADLLDEAKKRLSSLAWFGIFEDLQSSVEVC